MDKKLAKKFSSFLKKLPDEKLRELIKTQDQLKRWHTAHRINKYVSVCFHARFTGKNDPIAHWKSQGKLQHMKWELIWHTVDVYASLWGLIQLAFDDIKNFLVTGGFVCPYSNAFDLFLEITAIKENATYSNCLKPLHQRVVSQEEQFYKLSRNKYWVGSIKPQEQEKWDRLSKNIGNKIELLNFVWAVCLFNAQSNSLIDVKVREFKSKAGLMFDCVTSIYGDSRKGRFIEGKLRSSTWIDGIEHHS
jgi:hypothetical protein